MAFRALRSTVFKHITHSSIRSAVAQTPALTTPATVRQVAPFWRSFAAEAGFLDKDDVTNRVLEVVRKFEKVQPEKVSTSSHFVDDLGLDSLDTVELVMAFEDEFAVEIPDVEAEKIHSCEDAVNYISSNAHAK